MQKKSLVRAWILLLTGGLLLLVSSFFDYIKVQKVYLNRAASTIERSLHKHEDNLKQILEDEQLLRETGLSDQKTPELLTRLKNKPFYLFLYRNSEIIFWSTNELVIRNINLLPDEGSRVINIGNGYYEVIRRNYSDGMVALGVIPLYRQYEWENRYLKDGFVFKSSFLKRVRLTLRDNVPSAVSVQDNSGNFLFAVIPDKEKAPGIDVLLLILQVTGIVLLFAGVSYMFGYFFLRVKRRYLVLPWLLAFVVLVDVYINQLGVLAFSRYSMLFSDTIFASIFFGSSLGQFFLRCILSLWVVLLLNKYINISILKWPDVLLKYRPIVLTFIVTGWYIFVVETIKSLVLNSTINFEFYNFQYINGFSVLGIAGLGCLLASLYLVFDLIHRITRNITLWHWLAGSAIVLGWELFHHGQVWWLALLLSSFHFLLAAMTHVSWKGRFALFRSLILVSLLSAILSAIVVYFSMEKNLLLARDLSKELLIERNSLEEVGFIDAVNSILSDNSIRAFLKSPYIHKIDLNERIRSRHLKRYASKYDIESYATAANGRPLAGDMPAVIEILLKDKSTLQFTKAEGFFYVKNTDGGYLGIIPFYDTDGTHIGTLNIRLTQKIFTTYSAYPILLQNDRDITGSLYDKFDFAVYDSTRLVRSRGEVPMDQRWDLRSSSDIGMSIDGPDHWEWVESKDNRTVIISWKRTRLAFISLFSYMLFFLLFLFFVLEISGASYSRYRKYPLLQEFMTPSLQRNIQSSMILLVLLSLLMVGAASLLFFTYQYGNYYNTRAVRQVNGLSKDIGYLLRSIPDTASTLDYELKLLANLQRLSEVSEVDINFFNPHGELMATTQPEIFLKGLMSEKISPEAYHQLGAKSRDMWQIEESIGKLRFTSIYLRVALPSGSLLGYLQCPFYEKQRNLKEDLSFFVVSFVNFYVLLILIAALAAVVLSGSITNSLSAIREHMGSFRIGKKNKPIALESKDEIGALVSEYNRMMSELEKSAELLAQSEREGAWREMAKQVAHEIKNPLTPMKLGIQHLQRAVADDREDLPELTRKIAGSLIEQIDTLAGIATAFADFAKMPKAQEGQVDLGDLLQSAVRTFRAEKVDIHCELPDHPVMVRADKSQLLRVFNNLIKNAIQSLDEKAGVGEIRIALEKSGKYWRISIHDNGVGIPEERLNKIFQPNFTTKSSGTGLGLAISKSIIDHHGGKIWVESLLGEGSAFYIELPEN
jgi:two-component system, NtrC family, nitrogen regulation sensor histidine kinase NtrY